MRALFAACALFVLWSLLAWWGAAFGPIDHYKFGARGAVRLWSVSVGDTDSAVVEERCSWYFSGPFDQYCRPRPGGETRFAILRLGAPLLIVCLIAAVVGVFVPRPGLGSVAAIAAALATIAIRFNAEAALPLGDLGRTVGLRGTGFVAAMLAMIVAAIAAMQSRRSS